MPEPGPPRSRDLHLPNQPDVLGDVHRPVTSTFDTLIWALAPKPVPAMFTVAPAPMVVMPPLPAAKLTPVTVSRSVVERTATTPRRARRRGTGLNLVTDFGSA